MNVLSVLSKTRLHALLRAATAGLLLVAGSATAQLLVHAPAQNDVILAGQSTSLSVTAPTSATFSTPDGSYAQVTLEVRVEPLANAGDEARSAFERSGMTVEFVSALTAEGGAAVRDQDGATQIVFGDADDGEIRLGSRSEPVLGVASPTPDEDSTFALTVVFSAAPDDGVTAVPTPAEVSAIIAAIQITLPGDSSFEDDFLLRVMLSSPGGEDTETVEVVLDAEPQPPEIMITPPTNSTVTAGGPLLVVASAAGAMSEIEAGDVACNGRRCSTPRAYFTADCAAVPGRTLPTTCISADTDRDRRPELPALYSRVVWLVVNDERVVLASEEQWFYVAPVIGFDVSHKVIPADAPGAISIGLSISAVPEGAVLGNVTVVPMMDDNAVMGASVTFSDRLMSADTVIGSPVPGMLTLEFSDPGQNSRDATNYATLTPDDVDNADNYLYAIGNGEIEVVALQEGLIRFESAAPLPLAATATLTIGDLIVSSGTVTYTLTEDEVEVSVLNNPDAVSSLDVTFSGNDLTVAFDAGVLLDGDVVTVSLSLVSAREPPSTLVRSLQFPVALSGVAGDGDGNNVPDDAQGTGLDVLPVYDEEGTASSPVRVSGGRALRVALGAHALGVALRSESPLYSAAFSPESLRDERENREDALPGPPSYNGAGVFDFSIHDLDNAGDVATVFIPLLGEARGGASLSKYAADDDGNFAWRQFVVGQGPDAPGLFDRVWSAPAIAGVCPVLGASRGDGDEYAWRSAQDGLRSGDACLLLQIQDGGANDADGLVNGVIHDPNAVTGGGGGGGSGAMTWAWLWLMLAGWMIASLSRRC